MPGTPMNPENTELNKLQNEEPRDAQEEPENGQNEPVVRELTLTDVLNKRLLVSFLDRINKSVEQSDSVETQSENKDQVESDF